MSKKISSNFSTLVKTLPQNGQISLSDSELNSLALINPGLSHERVLIVCETEALAEIILEELFHYFKILKITSHELIHYPEVNAGNGEYDLELKRSRALNNFLDEQKNVFCVCSTGALIRPVVPSQKLNQERINLKSGSEQFSPEELCVILTKMGYDNEVQATLPGEFSSRGGILDIFSPDQSNPVRLEFFDREIESMRIYDPDTQRSQNEVKSFVIGPVKSHGEEEFGFLEYCKGFSLIKVNPHEIDQHLVRFYERSLIWEKIQEILPLSCEILNDSSADLNDFPVSALAPVYRSSLPEAEHTVRKAHQRFLIDRIQFWLKNQWYVKVFCGSESGSKRLEQMLDEQELKGVEISVLALNYGFIVPSHKIAFLSEQEIFGRQRTKELKGDGSYSSQLQKNLEYEPELNEGDFAVHANYGICRYLGIEFKNEQEFLLLEFAEERKLYLPVDSAHLLMRYIGGKKSLPKLARLGTTFWKKAVDKAEGSARDYAAELLRMQAVRENSRGIQFQKDCEWQLMFEEAFPFEETPDQLSAIEEVKSDMEQARPMDRLLCGDVGFGKTEVAMRAAFKAVMSEHQVAVVVPTTVLSQQHFRSFCQRMADYPVRIACLSRFISKKEQKQVLNSMASGEVDIVIGTHRLLQKDIIFKSLGLLVIDEEQRFGVESKEALKRMRANVDILSMSATPIPRTLYLSMTGLRDFSTILTAPHNRKPVRTIVSKENDELVELAVNRELERGGQIYYLHNRVGSIDKTALRLKRQFKDANILVGHGQMDEEELEMVMNEFTEGDAQILVCTTIIESGMDIRNANTMIIERADRFGLSTLYQLRGRVGRDHRQAYCYLLLPGDELIMDNAKERLSALRKHTHPGAGFKLAMRDLEIRGAGNMLGAQQSGHIAAVGFELYCQLLKKSVQDLKGEQAHLSNCVFQADFIQNSKNSIKDGLNAAITPRFIESDDQRLEFYRRFANASSISAIIDLEFELKDRYGAFSDEVQAFVLIHKIKSIAGHLGYFSIEIKGGKFYLEGNEGIYRENRKIPSLNESGLNGLFESEQLLRNIAKRFNIELI